MIVYCMNNFFYLCIIFILAHTVKCTVCMSEELNINAQNNSSIAMPSDKWEAVNITYTKNFPYFSDDKAISPECIKVFIYLHNKKKNKQKTVRLRCNENITLLRPVSVISRWSKFQKKNGYLLFTMKEYGLVNIHTHMTKTVLPHGNTFNMNLSGRVTGIFFRHTRNAKEYKFRNIKDHTVSSIIMTPEHPVFIKNKQTFIPIGAVSFYDTLSNKNLHLLCQEGQRGDCGIPYHPQKLEEVYNIEIYKNHTYVVGKEKILVHNICHPTPQELYAHFNTGGDVSEQPIYLSINDAENGAPSQTREVVFHNSQITVSSAGLSGLLNKHADSPRVLNNSFSYEVTLKRMGFIKQKAPLPGTQNKETWYLKYPIPKEIFEKYILPHLTDQYTFDKFVTRHTGRSGLCYYDLYELLTKISPPEVMERYLKPDPGSVLTSTPMLFLGEASLNE